MKNFLPILGCLFLLFSCSEEERTKSAGEAQVENSIPVRIAEISQEDIVLSIQAAGQVASENEAKPAFKTGGVIANMYAEEGSFVKKGQLLASLDLTEIKAQVQQASAAVEKARRDLQRAENLYADSVATLENVQDARTGLNIAEQNLHMADFNKNFSEIRSPIAGKVIKKLANNGEIVGPGIPAYFILGNANKDWVIKAGLADRDWARVKVGDTANIRFDAYPGKSFSATIKQLADSGNPGSGTFDVELKLTQKVPRMAAGLIASVEIFPKTKSAQTVIPLDALVETNRFDAKVFTIKENTAKVIPVKIAFLHHEKVVVQSGLEGVENIVTDGAPYLYDGAAVEIIK